MCKPGHLWINDLKIDTIIDVGANVGDFSKEMRKYRPEALIYAFEPLPYEYDALITAFKYDKRFKSFNLALSDKEAVVPFNVTSFGPASSILQMNDTLIDYINNGFKTNVTASPILVQAVTLDSIFADSILGPSLLVKIDTQGFEDKVIKGGEKTIRRAKVCFLETEFQPLYKGQALFIDILNQMDALGFTYFGDKDYVSYHLTNGTALWQDSIFVNKSLLKDGVYQGLS
jgi:FkbM family methyltransferase